MSQADTSRRSGGEKAAWNRLWPQHIKYYVVQFDARPGRSSRGKGCSSLPAGRGEIWGLNHLAGKLKKKKKKVLQVVFISYVISWKK